MNVKETSPTATPSLFYMPSVKLDENNEPVLQTIYDDEANPIGTEEVIEHITPVEVTTNTDHASLKRKCEAGVQELRVYPMSSFPIQLLVNDVLMAEQSIVIEIFDGTNWVTPPTVDKIIDFDADGVFDALVSVGAGEYLSVACNWSSFLPDPDKQVFTASAPGKLVRIVWYIKSHDPEYILRYDDFDGDVEYSLVDNLVKVIFEPSGVMDYLEV